MIIYNKMKILPMKLSEIAAEEKKYRKLQWLLLLAIAIECFYWRYYENSDGPKYCELLF